MTTRQLLIAILAGAGLAMAPATLAQDALGSGDALGGGNALDANPQVGSGGVNTLSRDWQAEIAFRNAIVTGNVGGGRQFRGSVGYTGASDFRGALGSDLIYNFQRETFYSGLATRQIRGIEASTLLMQGSISDPRGGLSGGLVISRPGAGVQSGTVTGSSITPQNQLNDLMAFDRVNTTLRSTSAFTVRDAIRPEILGVSSASNDRYFAASPLGGVGSLSLVDPSLVSGRSISPEQFDLDPRAAIPGFREQAIRDQQLLNDLEDAEAIAARMPSHTRILNDLRDQAVRRGLLEPQSPPEDTDETSTGNQSDPGGAGENRGFEFPGLEPDDSDTTLGGGRSGGTDGSGEVDELDRLLRGFSRDLQPPQGLRGANGVMPDPLGRSSGLGQNGGRSADDPLREELTGVDAIASRDRMERVVELLREQSTTIDRIAPSSGGSLYAQHMRAGERLLGEGMWFIAEERFVAALSSRPGDAMAAIGRVHAQIGAGLYLSAAVNLSDLLRAYPELAPVRYDRALIPGDERLASIRRQLRQRSQDDDAAARNAGFLLAYLGFQTNRPDDVREGIAIVRRVNEALESPDDPLVDVLAEIWSKPAENQLEPFVPKP
jgi:hypothetical protein